MGRAGQGIGRGLRVWVAGVVVMVTAACGGSNAAGDPFQWLEELDSPRVQEWVAKENARTLGVLEQDSRYGGNLAEAVAQGSAPDRLPMPEFRDGMIGNFWQDGAHPRGIYREASAADYQAAQPQWKTVLDLDALGAAEGKNWVWEGIDCDPVRGSHCLVWLSEGGEDAVTVREFDRAGGKFVPGGFELGRGKQSVAWENSDTLLVAREWEPGEKTTSGYAYVVKRWQRGQPLDQAVEVARGDSADGGGTAPLALTDGAGRRVNLVVRELNSNESEFEMLRSGRAVPLALPAKSDVKGMVADRVLVALRQDWTVDGATFRSGALISLDADDLTGDPARPRPTLVYAPGPQETVRKVLTTRDYAVVTSLYDVRGRATVYTPEANGGWTARSVVLPDNATVSPVTADRLGNTAYLSVSSPVVPAALWSLDAASAQAQPVKTAPARFDSSRFVVEQLETTSPDGTSVPYFVVRAADLKFDGTNPTILYAYGGFGLVSTPTYNGLLGKLWLERGGVYVIANIRGGGEYGPAWHEAALKTNRQRAFDDFTAVADDLIARGVTTPRHLGIQGGSNGGLLMGVEFTQHPELWNAVDIQIPLLDMLRYERIAAGASWTGEYGSVANPAERAFLASISPYARLKADVKYPEPFIWTSTKDDRVGPQHARKFAARLAELGDPYLFYEATQGGHAAGSNIDERARTAALEYTYLQRQLMN